MTARRCFLLYGEDVKTVASVVRREMLRRSVDGLAETGLISVTEMRRLTTSVAGLSSLVVAAGGAGGWSVSGGLTTTSAQTWVKTETLNNASNVVLETNTRPRSWSGGAFRTNESS